MHITTACNIITVTKKAAWISGVWNLFTHTIIVQEQTSICYNFHLFSVIHQEAIYNTMITSNHYNLSGNVALCAEAGFVKSRGVTRSKVIPGPETEVIGESGSGSLGAQPPDAEKGLILHVLKIS